jgi:O-antigen chain-terminating methyltransferase
VSEHAGFARTKILGLQESPALRFQQEVSLQDVLAGASPDYAVIAQTSGSTHSESQLNAAFEREYGISTTDLAQGYAAQQTRTIKALKSETQDLRELLQREIHQVRQLQQQMAVQIELGQREIELLKNATKAIQRSIIWPLVRPLQWAADQYFKLREHGLKTRWLALLRKLGWAKAKPGSSDQTPD